MQSAWISHFPPAPHSSCARARAPSIESLDSICSIFTICCAAVGSFSFEARRPSRSGFGSIVSVFIEIIPVLHSVRPFTWFTVPASALSPSPMKIPARGRCLCRIFTAVLCSPLWARCFEHSNHPLSSSADGISPSIFITRQCPPFPTVTQSLPIAPSLAAQ